MRPSRFQPLGSLAILMTLCAGAAYAQFNSAIQGIISDNSNSAVPGATVTVTNVDTGIARTAETLDEGLYRLLSLAPGTYRIVAHKPGFADAVRDAVTVITGQ